MRRISDDKRPVKLRKFVIGYKTESKQSPFQFDMNLNYKLMPLVQDYWNGKPILVCEQPILRLRDTHMPHKATKILATIIRSLLIYSSFIQFLFQIFCSTRKSVEMTHNFLHKNFRLPIEDAQKIHLQQLASQ